jgi:hypothetical protein
MLLMLAFVPILAYIGLGVGAVVVVGRLVLGWAVEFS